jgi:hypothetical protein
MYRGGIAVGQDIGRVMMSIALSARINWRISNE